jgi:hypothetical protein
MNNITIFLKQVCLVAIAIAFGTSLVGCGDDAKAIKKGLMVIKLPTELTYVNIEVLTFVPIAEGVIPKDIQDGITSFLENTDHGVVPAVTIKNAVNLSLSIPVTKRLVRGEGGVYGDVNKHKFVKNEILKNILPSINIPKNFEQPFIVSDEIKVKYKNELEKGAKIFITFNSDPEDTSAQVHNAQDLVLKISEEVTKNHLDITVLYNMPFISPVTCGAMDLRQLEINTESANSKVGAEKKAALDKVNLNIEATLSKDENNAYTWYIRAVNRTYAGDTKNAIAYLRNAAKISLEGDSAYTILKKIDFDSKTKLRALSSSQSTRLNSIKNALEQNDVNLLDIIFNALIPIGNTDQREVYLYIGKEPYNNATRGYSIAALTKDGYNNVALNINLTEKDSEDNTISKPVSNFVCPYGIDKSIYYNENSSLFTVRNVSSVDKNYVKLIISNRQLK